jgi:excinuclease ABC subunit C
VTIRCDADLDQRLDDAPAGSAVFAIFAAEGEPHLGRTAVLRRRLKRLLRKREGTSRILNLREIAARVEYWPVASRLEGWLVLYEVARAHLGDSYLEFLKLRMPPYVRLILGTPFPRTQVTTRLAGAGVFYGPFRARSSAEQFDHELLDLFQLRRCPEELAPSSDHPGCIYGEMNMCLRPCQLVVGEQEYASEVVRFTEFLRTDGRTALASAQAARDRLSAEMEFEAASGQHKRVEKIQEVLKLRDDLARDIDSLHGVAVLPAVNEGAVTLLPMVGGVWQAPIEFAVAGAHSESMDARLRTILAAIISEPSSARERQEHLAILSRWFYSSWRDGAWVGFDTFGKPPYRRLVTAISRVVHQTTSAASH